MLEACAHDQKNRGSRLMGENSIPAQPSLPSHVEQTDHSKEKDFMSEQFPVTYIARHGDTAWTVSGQHTGLIDLPLNEMASATRGDLGSA